MMGISGENSFYFSEKKKLDPSSLINPVCIQGMPGIALVGKAAVEHIIKELNAEKVLEIYFYDLPPQVLIKDGTMNLSKTELHFWRDENQKHDLFLLTGDAQPTSHTGANLLSSITGKYLADNNTGFLMALAASAVQIPVTEPNIYVSASSSEVLRDLKDLPRIHPFRGGIITGMNGMLPAYMKRLFGIESCVLLVEACRYLERDLNASKFLVETVNRYLDINISIAYLEERIEKEKTQVMPEYRPMGAHERIPKKRPDYPSYIG
ncbi:MAG: PAC2 family protein [Promethearchaeota archaeon]